MMEDFVSCIKQKKQPFLNDCFSVSGYQDSNLGPSGPKPDALTNCATPRLFCFGIAKIRTIFYSANFFKEILLFLIFVIKNL